MKKPSPPLDRYIRLIELLAAFRQGLSLTDISTLIKIPKGTVHRLLKTMQDLQLVDNCDGNELRYVIGIRARRLAVAGMDNNWITTLAEPILRDLTAETGETSFLAKLEAHEVKSILVEAPQNPWRGFVVPGKMMPPHAASSAKAILAYQDRATVDAVLAIKLEKFTAHTLTSRAAINKDHQKIRRAGFATCVEELADGLAAISVPVMTDQGVVLHSLGLTGPANRLNLHQLRELGSLMKQYAVRIGESLRAGQHIQNRNDRD